MQLIKTPTEALETLSEKGLVEAVGNGWRLTPAGERLISDVQHCHCGELADCIDGRGELVCARHYA